MATAKTSSFYVTETVTIPNGSAPSARVQAQVDMSSYINAPTGQGVAIESVDFIWQAGADFGTDVEQFVTSNGTLTMQLTDLNPSSAFVRADDQSLVASGNVNIDQTNNVATHVADLYPDNFGPTALSESFLCINDSLYLVGGNDGATTGALDLYLTARIKMRVVKLSNQDWVELALQATASDS